MKAKRPASPPLLKKGQLWKTKSGQVEIMEVGKLLVYYQLSAGAQKRIPTIMERVRVVQDYLKVNGGKLVKNPRV